MHPAFQLNSPFREPKWRLDRVLSLVDNQPAPLRPSRKLDDEIVAEYYKFLLNWRAGDSDEQRMQLFPRYPDVFYAHLLYYHPDKEWRWIVEACILARMSNEEIAAELGTTPGAIERYEKIFFNVRDRLSHELYIVKHVVGSLEHRRTGRDGQITEQQWHMMLKLYAYFGGEQVLRLMMAGFPRGAKPRSTRELMTWFDDVLQFNVRKKASIAANTFELNRYNVLQVMELSTKLLEIANNAATAQSSQSTLERNVEQVIESLHWVAGKRNANKHNAALTPYSQGAAELRADEQLHVAHGQGLDTAATVGVMPALRELHTADT